MIKVGDQIQVYVKKGQNCSGTILAWDGKDVKVEYRVGNQVKVAWFLLKISGRDIPYVAEK